MADKATTDKKTKTSAPQDIEPGKPGSPDARGYNPGVVNAAAGEVDEFGSMPMNRQDDPSPDEEQLQVKEKEAMLKEQGYTK